MIDFNKYKFDNFAELLDEGLADIISFDIYLANSVAMEKLPDVGFLEKSLNTNTNELLEPAERDKGEISSIVSSIINTIYYDKAKHNYLYLASALMDRIANKHAFYDGNKRTALYTAFIILNSSLNMNIELTFDNEEYIKEILSVVKNWQNGMSEEERIIKIEKFLNEIVLKN